MHDRSSQLQIKVGFHTLLRDRRGCTLRVSTLELSSQQISEPSFKQWDHSSHEEQPYSPSRCPETDSWSFSYWSSVEPSVDDMFQIFGHPDLLHELVLVSVHSRELTDVGEEILQSVRKLESVDVTKSELDVRVDDELGQSQDFSAEMEGVSESRSLSLLGRECLDGLQVHVVIQMKVVQVLSVDQEVEHVVTLSTDLKTCFDPVEIGLLEELGVLQTSEQVSLDHCLGSLVV